jgi:uncharacterized protein (DUF433 family)
MADTRTPSAPDTLAEALNRISKLEAEVMGLQQSMDELRALVDSETAGRLPELREVPVPPWKHLVYRPHRWRKQFSVRGKNATVGQLLSTIKANGLTVEQASDDLDLSVEAIHELLTYADQNRDLLAAEAEQERRLLAAKGHALEPANLPG